MTRTRAEARYRARNNRVSGVRADVPAAIRDALEAKPGDTLIFEQGCDRAVALAALRPDPYFVLTIERAKEVEPAAIVAAIEETPKPKVMESFAETVRKRLNTEATGAHQ